MIRLICFLAVFPVAAMAAPPRVMTDIGPIHSLTVQVMGDLGTADLLLPPDADPHDFALRPSDAARLTAADLVIWVGPGLTPWLREPLETLAPQAQHLVLLDTSGWDAQEARSAMMHADEDHDDHGHDDHGHDDHGQDAHDHGEIDPHGWMDPAVARVWVTAISGALGAADPENAAEYARNAENARAALTRLETEIAERLSGLQDRGYILPHDGYRYFEDRFGLTPTAAIAGADGRTPGPAHIAELREMVARGNVACVFTDAEIGDRWATLVAEGTGANRATLDGIGRGLTPGATLHAAMLERMADSFAACLGD